jgi:hypothetical protein
VARAVGIQGASATAAPGTSGDGGDAGDGGDSGDNGCPGLPGTPGSQGGVRRFRQLGQWSTQTGRSRPPTVGNSSQADEAPTERLARLARQTAILTERHVRDGPSP